jgi:hypothetical protein
MGRFVYSDGLESGAISADEEARYVEPDFGLLVPNEKYLTMMTDGTIREKKFVN